MNNKNEIHTKRCLRGWVYAWIMIACHVELSYAIRVSVVVCLLFWLDWIGFDLITCVVPMQCTGNSGRFPWGKASSHSTALPSFFFFFFFCIATVMRVTSTDQALLTLSLSQAVCCRCQLLVHNCIEDRFSNQNVRFEKSAPHENAWKSEYKQCVII